jgi:hypothetical protein
MKLHFTAYILILAVVSSTPAQQSSHELPQKENQPSQEITKATNHNPNGPMYVITPFNPSVDKLPADYRGHDIIAVYRKVENAVPLKGEFETTEQYKERLKNVPLNDLYAFKIEPSRAVAFFYDANKQTMDMMIETRPVTIIDPTVKYDTDHRPVMVAGITINSGAATTSSYTGQNAYGATREVTKSVGADFGIAIEKLPETMIGSSPLAAYGMSSISLSFSITPERAKIMKAKLGVLFICTLKSPFRLSFDRSVTRPTFSDPVDALILHNTLYTALKGIWIYNTESGEVVKKFIIEK